MAPFGGKDTKCKTCGMAMQLANLERMSGADGEVTVTLLGMPTLACPHGHERRFIDPNCGPEFADLAPRSFPMTSRKGVVSKKHSCSRCGAALDQSSAQTSMLSAQLRPSKGAPFQMEVRGPVLQCRSCNQEQLPRDLEPMIFEAIAKAFQSAKI